MKNFRTHSIVFLSVIALIFCCNVYYLVTLYRSIRVSAERDVMTAMADADIDDMWVRTSRINRMTPEQREQHGLPPRQAHNMSGYRDGQGNFVTTSESESGEVSTRQSRLDEQKSYTNQKVEDIGLMMHFQIDPYIGFDLEVTDSVFRHRLSYRHIKPEFVAVEVVDSTGAVVVANPVVSGLSGNEDVFTYQFNPESGLSYRAYISPLTSHILDRMMGVMVTVFLLMVAFALAFRYLFRTVRHLRTIEEMKDDFVNNMTHELKTPIAIAYSANDALLHYDTANDPDRKKAYLEIALKQLTRLGELVEGILSMSMERRKTMALRPEAVELSPFLKEIAAAQGLRKDKKIYISVKVSGNPVIEADKTHLANMVNNLIDNAIKYSGEEVDIAVSADSDHISVTDNGIGIPQRSIPYLFNKFYRVPHGNVQDIRGYGIGLFYVKSIADRMGWDIEVRSRIGVGSEFSVRFVRKGSKA